MRNSRDKSQTTPCRKCRGAIPAGAKFCPECGTGRTSDAVPTILVVLLLGSSLLLMSSAYSTNKQISGEKSFSSALVSSANASHVEPPPPKDQGQAAYTAAKRLVQDRFPHARRISELQESPVTKSGDIFQVTLFVDSVENGAPVRNSLQVKLELNGGNWKLKEIVQ